MEKEDLRLPNSSASDRSETSPSPMIDGLTAFSITREKEVTPLEVGAGGGTGDPVSSNSRDQRQIQTPCSGLESWSSSGGGPGKSGGWWSIAKGIASNVFKEVFESSERSSSGASSASKQRTAAADFKAKFPPPNTQIRHGLIREIAARTRSSQASSSCSNSLIDGNSNETLILPHSVSSVGLLIKKDFAFYCTARGMIPGTLTVGRQIVTFEPERRAPLVRHYGVGEFQVVIPMSEIVEAAAVILPATPMLENLFNLPTISHAEDDLPRWVSKKTFSSSSEAENASSCSSSSSTDHQPEAAAAFLQIQLRSVSEKRRRAKLREGLSLAQTPPSASVFGAEEDDATPTKVKRQSLIEVKTIDKKNSHSSSNDRGGDKMEGNFPPQRRRFRSEEELGSTKVRRLANVGMRRPKGFSSSIVDSCAALPLLTPLDADPSPRDVMVPKPLLSHRKTFQPPDQSHGEPFPGRRRTAPCSMPPSATPLALPPFILQTKRSASSSGRRSRRHRTTLPPAEAAREKTHTMSEPNDSSTPPSREEDEDAQSRQRFTSPQEDDSVTLNLTAPANGVSFILFRLNSPTTVKRLAPELLKAIDDAAERVASSWVASVPYLSNDVLPILMSLTNEEHAAAVMGDDVTRSVTMPELLARSKRKKSKRPKPPHLSVPQNRHPSSSLQPPPHAKTMPSEGIASLFREAPPNLSIPSGTFSLLTDSQLMEISLAIPPSIALRLWEVVFDTNLHGISFLSFYRKVRGYEPILLVIRDHLDKCFGAFCPEGLYDNRRYHGSGETFVFTFKSGPLQQYTWTGRNQFFVYSYSGGLCFGGGGRFALAIDGNFREGTSVRCPTFNNEPLTDNEDFRIKNLQKTSKEKTSSQEKELFALCQSKIFLVNRRSMAPPPAPDQGSSFMQATAASQSRVKETLISSKAAAAVNPKSPPFKRGATAPVTSPFLQRRLQSKDEPPLSMKSANGSANRTPLRHVRSGTGGGRVKQLAQFWSSSNHLTPGGGEGEHQLLSPTTSSGRGGASTSPAEGGEACSSLSFSAKQRFEASSIIEENVKRILKKDLLPLSPPSNNRPFNRSKTFQESSSNKFSLGRGGVGVGALPVVEASTQTGRSLLGETCLCGRPFFVMEETELTC